MNNQYTHETQIDSTIAIKKEEEKLIVKGINESFFQDILRKNLAPERIKEKLGDPLPNWKNDGIEDFLLEDDKKRLLDYERLEVSDLPFDWKIKLERLEYLEERIGFYNENKQQLEAWNETFPEFKPSEINEKINWLEIQQKELANEKEELLAQCQKLSEEITEWRSAWENKDIKKIKEEWENLNKRPDLPITEKDFYDDYARRKPIEVSKKEAKELTDEKEKVGKIKKEMKSMENAINEYLKNERLNRFSKVEPVYSVDSAKKAIGKLLEQTYHDWNNFLNDTWEEKDKIDRRDEYAKLGLIFCKERNRTTAKSILELIAEAQKTNDYKKLSEAWNQKERYNESDDFDGTLYLLRCCYLEFIEKKMKNS